MARIICIVKRQLIVTFITKKGFRLSDGDLHGKRKVLIAA